MIVSFYFGARQQAKSQGFQRDLAQSLSRVPLVADNLVALDQLRSVTIGTAQIQGHAEDEMDVVRPEENPALLHWQDQHRGNGV